MTYLYEGQRMQTDIFSEVPIVSYERKRNLKCSLDHMYNSLQIIKICKGTPGVDGFAAV